jgi:uncharacterized protein YecE (DUF72 family)
MGFPGAVRREAVDMIRIGCSGWSYDDWRGRLYPSSGASGRWLELYASRFDTVEVNATFYRLPPVRMVARWAEVTPSGFCFAVKASRYLTHVKRLRELGAGISRLVERLEPLRAAGKLGPTLWQLPPTFRRDDERLADALDELGDGRHAFEFRDESWFDDAVYALLRDRRVALVVADRAGLPPARWVDTGGWWYLRFHHGRAGRRGNYSDAELGRWARRIGRVDGDVYAYFNNDWEGFAPENADTLGRLLRDLPGGGLPAAATGSRRSRERASR